MFYPMTPQTERARIFNENCEVAEMLAHAENRSQSVSITRRAIAALRHEAHELAHALHIAHRHEQPAKA